MYEAIEEVLSEFPHLPKSAMFKTVGYSPGFLPKLDHFRTFAISPETHTNSPASS